MTGSESHIPPQTAPTAYTHRPEAPFEDNVADWFRAFYGEQFVEQQQWQPDVRWYCDIVVTLPYATLYIETESRHSEVRSGMAQALGYAAQDPQTGVPMVIAPVGHLPDKARLDRLRATNSVLVRAFDSRRGVFVEDEKDEPTTH